MRRIAGEMSACDQSFTHVCAASGIISICFILGRRFTEPLSIGDNSLARDPVFSLTSIVDRKHSGLTEIPELSEIKT